MLLWTADARGASPLPGLQNHGLRLGSSPAPSANRSVSPGAAALFQRIREPDLSLSSMGFVGGRGPPYAAADADDVDVDRHFPERPLQYGAGDPAMLVIRDALLSQLQRDRLRQEIIVAELAKIERAMAPRSAGAERGEPAVPVAYTNEQVMPSGGMAAGARHVVAADEACGPKKDAARGGVEMQPEEPAAVEVPEYLELIVPPTKPPPSSAKWCCAICLVQATSEGNLQQHFAGQKHQSNVAAFVSRSKAVGLNSKTAAVKKPGTAGSKNWVCRFCQSSCTCKSDLESHLRGKRHRTKILALLKECESLTENCGLTRGKSDPDPQGEENQGSAWSCCLCQAKGNSKPVLESHLRGKRHKLNFLVLQVEAMPFLSQVEGCGAKCIAAESQVEHGKSRERQRDIEALQRECKVAKSNAFKTSSKLPGKSASAENMEVHEKLYFCKLCSMQCNSKNTLAEHRRGKKHLEKVEKRKLLSFCEVCNLQCNSEKMLAHHRTGKTHLANLSGC